MCEHALHGEEDWAIQLLRCLTKCIFLQPQENNWQTNFYKVHLLEMFWLVPEKYTVCWNSSPMFNNWCCICNAICVHFGALAGPSLPPVLYWYMAILLGENGKKACLMSSQHKNKISVEKPSNSCCMPDWQHNKGIKVLSSTIHILFLEKEQFKIHFIPSSSINAFFKNYLSK